MENLREIYSHSIRNRKELKKSKKCGCFYCMEIFNPCDIKHWYREKGGEKTAICPHCGIDSIIAETEDYKITKELLEEMRKEYF